MKRPILSILAFFLLFLAQAQIGQVVFQGQVSDLNTSLGIPNHPVLIQSDSANSILLYNAIVLTDQQGYYHHVLQNMPVFGNVLFYIKTEDCNGVVHVATGNSINSPIVSNFSICYTGGTSGCASYFTALVSGNTVNFNAFTSSTLPTVFTWDFGDGSVGTGAYVTHTYAQAGVYVVTMISANSVGCTYTYASTVVIGNTLPCQASFLIYPDTASPGLSYYFVNTSTGNPTSFQWSFGDGTSSNLPNPQHTYTLPGAYQVCLTIGGNAATSCNSTYCDTLIAGPVNACYNSLAFQISGLNVAFMSQVVGAAPYQYLWSFGDGGTSTLPNPVHTYAAGGGYLVSLTTTDANACSYTSTQYITLGNLINCAASFTYFQDSLNPGVLHFINTSTGNPAVTPVSWFWDFGDSTISTAMSPVHAYTAPGTYVVCLTMTVGIPGTPGYCTNTYCTTITLGITNPCAVSFTYLVNNLTVHFTAVAQGTPPSTYVWNFGDGGSATSLVPNISHTYANPGNYLVTVYLTSSNNCIAQSSQAVNVGTGGNLQVYGTVYAGTAGAPMVLVTLMGFGPATGVLLQDSTMTNAAGYYQFSNVPPGIYLLKATPVSSIISTPQYAPTYYGNTLHWSTATVLNLSSTQNPYDIQLIPVPGPGPGPAQLGGTVTNGGAKINTKGTPAPGVQIMLMDANGNILDVEYSNLSGHFEFGDISYGTYQIYPEVPGLTTIPVMVTLSPSNPVVTNIEIVITGSGVITAIPDNKIGPDFSVYPNPSQGDIKLFISGPFEGTWALYAADGRTIRQEALRTAGEFIMQIPGEKLSSGIYFLEMKGIDYSSKRLKLIVR